MANRNWNRGSSYYGGAYGVPSIGYYVPPPDRRYVNNAAYSSNKAYGSYREEKRRDDRKRPHSPARDRRDVSRNDRGGQKRGPAAAKYDVRVPKHQLGSKHLTCLDMKTRLPRLTIPSDLANVECNWTDSYPMNEPFSLFHREVEVPFTHESDLINIDDANYSYSARVMFLGTPPSGEMMKNSCVMADDTNSDGKIVATKNFNFLVGGRIRTECMALGGPWSPSLDGSNPEKNPQTLINTAIRTFKGFTGVDLSSCNQWIRFMEMKYQRHAGSKAPSYVGDEEDRLIEADCVETVVFFIPVISHMCPSETEWADKKSHYSDVLQRLLKPKEVKPETQVNESAEESALDDSTVNTSVEATHYSKLDINSMKVQDLKNELTARGIDAKGLKVVLVSKLETVLAEEKAKEESVEAVEVKPEEPEENSEQNSTKQTAPEAAAAAEPKEKVEEVSERDRRRLERLYRLDDKPAILIHPNSSVRAGKFDCHRATLCSLLDYRHDDPKEMGFEVVLFAQQFNEMLQRDCIFNIFRAVYHAPEREVKEETKENGLDGHEPDVKRIKEDEEAPAATDEANKVRKHKRTVDPKLLFSFVFFDTGRADFIRDPDLVEMIQLLDLGYSKNQLRKWINRIGKRKDHVQYRNLTDKEVVENSEEDVTNFELAKPDPVDLRTLSLGNTEVLHRNQPSQPAKIVLGGDMKMNERLDRAEKSRQEARLSFFKLKEEFENVRVKLNNFQDIEDKLKADNKDLSQRLKNEQKMGSENRSLVTIYGKLLREAKFHMEKSLNDINKQFDKEKEKRDAEKAEADKAKEEQKKVDDKVEKKEEGDIVVDTA